MAALAPAMRAMLQTALLGILSMGQARRGRPRERREGEGRGEGERGKGMLVQGGRGVLVAHRSQADLMCTMYLRLAQYLDALYRSLSNRTKSGEWKVNANLRARQVSVYPVYGLRYTRIGTGSTVPGCPVPQLEQ